MKVLFVVKIRRVRQVLAQSEVKIMLISTYNDHQEILNNFKSNKGKKYGRRHVISLLDIAKRLALEVP